MRHRPLALTLTWIGGLALFALSFHVTYPDQTLHAVAVASGCLISTVIAFRWAWSGRYDWSQCLLSIRPMFQSIAFLYIIIGPLSALSGAEQIISNYGSKEFYWILYLGAPLAFLGYELGYAAGLGGRQETPIAGSGFLGGGDV